MNRSLGALALVLALGCQAPATLGAGCERASQCAEPLACANGRCRAQCVDDRDCANATCETFHVAASAGVCVPPSTPLPCVFHSDCSVGLFCRSGQCVIQCAHDRDCERGTCIDGACSEVPTTPPATDAGVLGDGSACLDHCGARCVDLMRDPQHCGRCGNACAAAQVCISGSCTACPVGGCPPPNDLCVDATSIALTSFYTHVSQDATGATPSTPSCDAGSPNVYFAIDVPSRTLLGGHVEARESAQTFGGFFDRCTDTTVACADGIGFRVVDRGHYLYVAGFQEAEPRDFDFFMLPLAPSTPANEVVLNAGATTRATGRLDAREGSGLCGLSGPDTIYYGSAPGPGWTGITQIVCSGLPEAQVVEVTSGGVDCQPTPCDGSTHLHTSPGSGMIVVAVVGASPTTTGAFTIDIDPYR